MRYFDRNQGGDVVAGGANGEGANGEGAGVPLAVGAGVGGSEGSEGNQR